MTSEQAAVDRTTLTRMRQTGLEFVRLTRPNGVIAVTKGMCQWHH